jgi:hypothetical protein
MSELSEQVERLQNLLVAEATGGGSTSSPSEYKVLRAEVVAHHLLKDIAPRFLRTCRTTAEFWQFIKQKFPSYAERRRFIWDEFRPLFDRIEGTATTPADKTVSVALEKFDAETVHQIWLKALERRETDPDGAITIARTLLETMCKHILDENGEPYQSDADLPGLYRLLGDHPKPATCDHLKTGHSE